MTAPDPRVSEIEARLSAATPGPWEEFWRGHIHAKGELETVSVCQTFGPEDQTHPNAEFIAAAPADVAFLLAELREAREALGRVERLIERPFGSADKRHYDDDFNRGHCAGYNAAAHLLRAAVAATNGDGDAEP